MIDISINVPKSCERPRERGNALVWVTVCRTGTVLGIAIGESRLGDGELRRDGDFSLYGALVVQNFDDLAVNSGFEDEFAVSACPLRKDIGSGGGADDHAADGVARFFPGHRGHAAHYGLLVNFAKALPIVRPEIPLLYPQKVIRHQLCSRGTAGGVGTQITLKTRQTHAHSHALKRSTSW